MSRKIQRFKPPPNDATWRLDGRVLQGFPMFGVRDIGYFSKFQVYN